MLTEKPLTTAQKWDQVKAEQRAESAAKKQAKVDAGRPMAGRAGRRAARFGGHGYGRRSRIQRGQSRHVDHVVFNINTGQREPLPRPVVEVTE